MVEGRDQDAADFLGGLLPPANPLRSTKADQLTRYSRPMAKQPGICPSRAAL